MNAAKPHQAEDPMHQPGYLHTARNVLRWLSVGPTLVVVWLLLPILLTLLISRHTEESSLLDLIRLSPRESLVSVLLHAIATGVGTWVAAVAARHVAPCNGLAVQCASGSLLALFGVVLVGVALYRGIAGYPAAFTDAPWHFGTATLFIIVGGVSATISASENLAAEHNTSGIRESNE